jgi:hypothetical protein
MSMKHISADRLDELDRQLLGCPGAVLNVG